MRTAAEVFGRAGRPRRAGRFAREEARRRELAYVRRNWLLIARLTVGACVPIVAIAWYLDGWASGFFTGACVAGFLAMVAWAVSSATGTASSRMGEQAERWTAEQLRTLERRGWRSVDQVPLDRGDVDHVAVGPAGAFAIETKWRARWKVGPGSDDCLGGFADAASRRARRMGSILRSTQVGVPLAVRPVLALWGPVDGTLPATVRGVPVVHGPALATWLAGQPPDGDPVGDDEVTAVLAGLGAYVAMRDDFDERVAPVGALVGRGPVALAEEAYFGVLAGAVAGLVALHVGPTLPVAAAILAVELAGAVLLRRRERLRVAALGLFTGVAGVAVALASAAAAFALV